MMSGCKKVRTLYLLFIFIIAIPFYSQASAYWMDVKGSGKVNETVRIKVYYGNIGESGLRVPLKGPELMLTGEFRLRVVDENGQSTPIPIMLSGDGWEGTFIPHQKGVYQILGINDTHPVVDRSKLGGINVLPIDFLCAAYTVESSGSVQKPIQFLDIITERRERQITVMAFKEGKPAKINTKLRVFNPENWEKELTVNEEGKAFFTATMQGLYIIRQDWNNPKPGEYKGVSYSSIRYRCNYFLLIQTKK